MNAIFSVLFKHTALKTNTIFLLYSAVAKAPISYQTTAKHVAMGWINDIL